MSKQTPTQQFIEDAIKGGWNPRPEETTVKMTASFPTEFGNQIHYFETAFIEDGEENGRNFNLFDEQILLDPLAWQAVGKTRGWTHMNIPSAFEDSDPDDTYLDWDIQEGWLYWMHRFIDLIADGKTIEEALSLIQ